MLNCESPRFHGFVRVSRPDDRKPRNSTQASEVLDWLVSRAILPESDAVVRKNVDRFEMTQSPQADGRLHVVGKYEKRRAEGKQTAVRGHSVHSRSHSVLANTERNVSPGIAPLPADCTQSSRPRHFTRLEISQTLEGRPGRRVQVR